MMPIRRRGLRGHRNSRYECVHDRSDEVPCIRPTRLWQGAWRSGNMGAMRVKVTLHNWARLAHRYTLVSVRL